MITKPLRVMIVDDHAVVRLGLQSLFRRHPGFEVVGEADSMAAAVELAAKASPDVVLMDVRLPDGSGSDACAKIRAANPETKVVMLTSYADDQAIFESILAGAAGYLLKEVQGQELLKAVRVVAEGGSLLDPHVTQKLLARFRQLADEYREEGLSVLSKQERNVLALIGEGMTNREIAEVLFLSEKTVRNYVTNILSKLHFSHRSQAAVFAAQNKLRFSKGKLLQ